MGEEKSGFTSEVEKRLNTIFGEETDKNTKTGVAQKTTNGVPEGFTELPTSSLSTDKDAAGTVADLSSLLGELKSSVLSIEWEITDQIMTRFDDQVNDLLDQFNDNRIMQGFLRILRFLGRYIKIKKKDAHPGSGKLLKSIFENMDKILLSQDMNNEEMYSILLQDITRYRDWIAKVDIA
jgi:hypothetical protein